MISGSRILSERKYQQWEQSWPFPVGFGKYVCLSHTYVLSVWLALLVHTGAHGIHVGSVCIVSLVSWLLLLFDAVWVVSMHDPQDPEDAAVTSDPFGYNKVNRGWTKSKTNKHEMVVMVVSLSMATLYNSHVVRFCFWSFSGLPVCCKFPRGCRCSVLYCQSLYILQLLVTQTRNDMKWYHWCFFWVGTSSSFRTWGHNRSIWFCQGTNGVKKE